MLLAVAVVSPLVPKAQSVMDTVPYHCDFENETQNGRWTLVNGTCYNYLCIDTLANTTLGGHKALYMTQQFMTPRANAYKVGSSTAGDNTYVTSRVFAYTHVYFPAAGEYDVGYWCVHSKHCGLGHGEQHPRTDSQCGDDTECLYLPERDRTLERKPRAALPQPDFHSASSGRLLLGSDVDERRQHG